jgi:hypothetical protein
MSRYTASLIVVAAGMSIAACSSSSSSGPDPVGVDAGPKPDAGADAPTGDGSVVTNCPKPTGGPTQHQGTIEDETWTADKSPHVLPYDLSVAGTLTIEPCAEVLIGQGKTIDVISTGKLIANGLATKPIHIGAQDPAKPFARIQAGGGGTLSFAYATIDNGGDPLNSIVDVTGAVFAQGVDQNLPSQPTVFVDHVTIAGSKSNGVDMLDGAGFAPGSQELTVTGSAQYPVAIWARALSGLPTGTYTGNATDEILLDGGGGSHAVHEDTTMHNRGVPYRVGNSLSGSNPLLVVERQAPSTPGLATLTIEAGVKVRVKKGGMVEVQRFTGTTPAQGAIVVNGTAAEPVVFTSAEPSPAPGDWYGIWFGLVPAANNKIDHARVEYAGATSGSSGASCNVPPTPDAAIRIFGTPSSSFVTNTTIADSARHGIDRGWRDDNKPDFLATNTFIGIAGCKQTYPSDTNGSCPSTVPCP